MTSHVSIVEVPQASVRGFVSVAKFDVVIQKIVPLLNMLRLTGMQSFQSLRARRIWSWRWISSTQKSLASAFASLSVRRAWVAATNSAQLVILLSYILLNYISQPLSNETALSHGGFG